uniref:Dna replication complex gins protein psf2-like n=1 Tax=Tetraselmis sp. GSL018 TaxID=582737 RepID=A0A061QMR5_9CHLO|mmetsp:Transcript_19821/g.47301  ORF Transcript_19821/g.47301 Transcript_19821/m.47301 type:complete len:113 (-) Transcript_19821:628-966(-)
MALFEDYVSKFSPQELEFFAEDELVQIVPNFSLPQDTTLDCVSGEYGPFQPNILAEVPLWMALALHKRKRCAIRPPEWMNPDNLQNVYEEERREHTVFQALPFHYVEVCRGD